jgi:hypothetical protein
MTFRFFSLFRILRRDGAQLNMLGGTDRLRLLNILMQLRKVGCPGRREGGREGRREGGREEGRD